ncbi:MAG: hypothetical protein KatS3mg108_3266 [Isosphaeraceae bacterium]|jgi:predicted  nucleic acid-binding Zn-ribbon protein|nr:MAG: hypothetical protein KatS3mg108_3266 [Isosphaeraceae bacterium]
MTYVGKILVILIMVLSLAFLTLSTVVFTTEKNWKDEVDKLKNQLSEVQKKNNALTEEKAKLENDLTVTQKEAEGAIKNLRDVLTQKDGELARYTDETTQLRKAVETAQENLRSAQQDADAKARDRNLALEQLRAVQNEANQYKIQQTELNDQIRILERELEQAKSNNRYLRDQLVTVQNVLKANNLEADPARYQKLALPPEVEGEVLLADAVKGRFQISIGSDDGLVSGHELYVYRLEPRPEYLGKVRVSIVDSDRAVVTLIGTTPQGKKIQEGDIVSTTIRPRG